MEEGNRPHISFFLFFFLFFLHRRAFISYQPLGPAMECLRKQQCTIKNACARTPL